MDKHVAHKLRMELYFKIDMLKDSINRAVTDAEWESVKGKLFQMQIDVSNKLYG